MDSFLQAWDLICENLKNNMTELAFNTWIKRIKPENIDFESGVVTLCVPNDFHKQTLTKSYIRTISDCVEEFFGTPFIIEFSVLSNSAEENYKKTQQENEENQKNKYTFDSFIIGPSNKLAFAVAQAVATSPAKAYNPLFIYGNSGLGKTHLLFAIGNYIKEQNPNANICYILGDEFANELIAALGSKTTVEFHNKYRSIDVLLVDDVHFLGGKTQTQEEFFHTFNSLYNANKQIVLTSDRPPKEIKTLEERLRSRFEQGFLADINPPDLETRIAIIKEKSEMLDFIIPDDICEFIAEKLKINIRQLEGVVKKLHAKFLLNNEKPTLKSAMDSISDILNNDTPPEQTIEKIIEEVARTFSLSSEDIRSSKSRKANISTARQVAIYISHELTDLPYVKIGDEFGKHYTTIVYDLKKVEFTMESNSAFKSTIEDIIKNIQSR
ncbi:MAG: chromosomal replication initiator protein DnaA [Oscillospiraceae bacterium]|jgi:chromosomal replication initiator protein|nr:chromosomal replication initiator protein DnaA [Oscillospiraceae bacterium]